MSHHPTLCRTSGHGCWATCSCGWTSKILASTQAAHLAFGDHLVKVEWNAEWVKREWERP